MSEGYVSSWLCFDFDEEVFMDLPFSEMEAIVQGVIIPKEFPDDFKSLFQRKWIDKAVRLDVFKKGLLFFETNWDFDCLHIASRIDLEKLLWIPFRKANNDRNYWNEWQDHCLVSCKECA